MRALFYTGTMQSELRSADEPVADEGEVIVNVENCGICGSDMHAWHGHDPRRVPPMILGHEISGIVDGKRVVVNPLMPCGVCKNCKAGRVHLCPDRRMVGMAKPGGFAESMAVDAANISAIPDHLSFEDAALAEPLACAVHAVRLGLARAKPAPDQAEIAVLGGGAIGLLSAMVFAEAGIENLWIAEVNPIRRKMLEKVVKAKAYDPREGGPEGVDLVLDAVGTGITRAASSQIVAPGGEIIHIGLQDSEAGLDTRRMTLQEIGFLGVYCYTPEDFAQAVTLLETGKVSGAGWVDVRPLSEGARSFQDIHDGKAPPKIILSAN